MLGREQRGIIDKIRRGEIEKPKEGVEYEIILDYDEECDNIKVEKGPPGSQLDIKQSASVEIVRASDREDQ